MYKTLSMHFKKKSLQRQQVDNSNATIQIKIQIGNSIKLPNIKLQHKYMQRLIDRMDKTSIQYYRGFDQLTRINSSYSNKKNYLSIIVQQLYEDALSNEMIGSYFKKINRERYCSKFMQYLRMLFKQDIFLQMEEVEAKHKFGLESRYYIQFKKILFRIIFKMEKINVLTVFDGCKRVQKFRLCIATENQYFKSVTLKQMATAIQQIIPGVSTQFSQTLIKFIFQSHGPSSFLQENRINKVQLTEFQYIQLKIFVIQLSVQKKVGHQLLWNSLQNLMVIKHLFYNRRSITQYLQLKFKSVSNFIAKVFNEIKIFIKRQQIYKRIFKLIFFQLFDIKDYNFSQIQVAYITNLNNMDSAFLDDVLVQTLTFLKNSNIIHHYYQQIVFKLKRLRRLNKKYQVNLQRHQLIAQFLKNMWKVKLSKFIRNKAKCPVNHQAFQLLHEQFFLQSQLRLIHKQVLMQRQSFMRIGELILNDHRSTFGQAMSFEYKQIKRQYNKFQQNISI